MTFKVHNKKRCGALHSSLNGKFMFETISTWDKRTTETVMLLTPWNHMKILPEINDCYIKLHKICMTRIFHRIREVCREQTYFSISAKIGGKNDGNTKNRKPYNINYRIRWIDLSINYIEME